MSNGTIITFYSYKGGVGRSLALANIAVCLARWGHRVLCVDWDLEAPGLHAYFPRPTGRVSRPSGLVDMITAYATGSTKVDWRKYVTKVKAGREGVQLSLMSAGKEDGQYKSRLHALSWDRLYEKRRFGTFLERLRAEWKSRYDFILVDSRTGVSDIGGITTIQLPDLVALMFTANEQSIAGSLDVARTAQAQRRALSIERADLVVVPIVSRFEGRVEKKIADEWLARIAKDFAPFYARWAHESVRSEHLLTFLRVPYVPYWSFGEKLPVLEEGTRDPETIGYSLETIAALFANGLAGTDVMISNRDTYVATARAGSSATATASTAGFKYTFFVSHTKEDSAYAKKLIAALKKMNITVFADEGSISGGDAWIDVSTSALQSSRHFLLLAGDHLSAWQKQLALSFFSLNFSESGSKRRIITVALPGTNLSELPSVLRQAEVVPAEPTDVRATARAVRRASAVAKGSSLDDPQKGRFGGKAEANGRRLAASVRPSSDDSDWFYIDVWVESTGSTPLTGEVLFHLHDTFDPPVLSVTAKGNVARESLGAYGAFTIGAEADGGTTRLELDLSTLSDAPARFRTR
jgi:cellulose biosynthesis protein BcsQ